MAGRANRFTEFLASFFMRGKCDNVTDQTFGSTAEEFIMAFVVQNCKGYGGVADMLGVSVATVRNIVSEHNVKRWAIQGNKEVIFAPKQIEQIRQIISQKHK